MEQWIMWRARIHSQSIRKQCAFIHNVKDHCWSEWFHEWLTLHVQQLAGARLRFETHQHRKSECLSHGSNYYTYWISLLILLHWNSIFSFIRWSVHICVCVRLKTNSGWCEKGQHRNLTVPYLWQINCLHHSNTEWELKHKIFHEIDKI